MNYGASGEGVHLWQTDPFSISWRLIKRDYVQGLNEVVIAENALTPDTWNYVAATYDYQSGMAKIYVGGNLTAETDIGSRVLATQDQIWLGSVSGDNRVFVGRLSCLQIHNKALTPEEIADKEMCPFRKFPLLSQLLFFRMHPVLHKLITTSIHFVSVHSKC